ncbi:hypothetical protein BH23ACT10_BH23ACT10_16610 [soil metagenome]
MIDTVGFVGLGNIGGKLGPALSQMARRCDLVITWLPSPAVVDGPVSGGCHRAATGNIAIFAGCDRAVFERMLPVLTAKGRGILHTGPVGSASVLKVVTNISFTMDLVVKDLGLFQAVADRCGVPLEISPALREVFDDAQTRYGPREWSPNVVRRLEEATGLELLSPGFPPVLVDDEPETNGHEVTVGRAASAAVDLAGA